MIPSVRRLALVLIFAGACFKDAPLADTSATATDSPDDSTSTPSAATTSTASTASTSSTAGTETTALTSDDLTDSDASPSSTGTTAPTPLCGDGVLDPGEACDGGDLGGATCQSQGFDAGTLACDAGCMFDAAGCSKCGDGVLDPGEACDDGNDTPGDGCDAACALEICDPDGFYQVQGPAPAYTCCNGLVSVNVNGFTLAGDGATITSSPSNPVAMTGAPTTCPVGSFMNQGSIPGGCTETYKVTGKFVDANIWTGTYDLIFTGNQCSCFQGMLGTPCVNQSFPVTAKR